MAAQFSKLAVWFFQSSAGTEDFVPGILLSLAAWGDCPEQTWSQDRTLRLLVEDETSTMWATRCPLAVGSD
ncbi:hypothetical protein NDU88_004359 [Pleurodeles waltl]|uniref:Uncharacterized protein n=1 Tax=Pleurodeles waltl TaxID=8319 RepID=A0AAV7WVF5_PLEWA|nr:hypothetical protein NDU88_004359 [Pleurodeles waltl]